MQIRKAYKFRLKISGTNTAHQPGVFGLWKYGIVRLAYEADPVLHKR